VSVDSLDLLELQAEVESKLNFVFDMNKFKPVAAMSFNEFVDELTRVSSGVT
jgi:acyl carrier protein